MEMTMSKLMIGVDVSKEHIDVAQWTQHKAITIGRYTNNIKGFRKLERELHDTLGKDGKHHQIHLIVEPTGGYEQPLARYAIEKGWSVSLPNPHNVRQWAKGVGIRAKTDKCDAKALARYGAEVNPTIWTPLPQEMEELSLLVDRLNDLHKTLRIENNRLDALRRRGVKHSGAIDNLNDTISFIESQISNIQSAIKDHFDDNQSLKDDRELLRTIPGVGEKNSPVILLLMHKWNLLTNGEGNAKGLTAFVGLDPVPFDSGTIHLRASISKKGDPFVRSQLYMGALGGIRGDNPLRQFYDRLVDRGKPKRLALVAAARKILVWAWAIFSSNQPFTNLKMIPQNDSM
jgi:transposase